MTLEPASPNRRTRITSLLLIAASIFALDQLSKYWLIYELDLRTRAPLYVNEYFSLVMAWNKGVSFSMFAHSAEWMPAVLTVVAVLISGLLAHLCLKSDIRLERIGYAMVIGGALGNACDRVRYGAVADFFYAHIGRLGWPAFNVADMAICTGVGLLLLAMLRRKNPA
ncbi:MAG: signal peptidase II [Rickettsiales bacterium]|nr:signal peptidase II [Rickettsiales bacterium]